MGLALGIPVLFPARTALGWLLTRIHLFTHSLCPSFRPQNHVLLAQCCSAAVWRSPCCAGGITHRRGLLGEITHLPVLAGHGLLFMCLILSAMILGVVKNLKMTVQEELAGAFALQENLTAAQGQPKLTWLCLFWVCPSRPGWCSHLLLALQWTNSAV